MTGGDVTAAGADPGPVHPFHHFRCDADCPCSCGDRRPYETQAGTMCRNCLGMIERKRVHRFELVAETGGIRVLQSVFLEVT
jgi:hypothetical protein